MENLQKALNNIGIALANEGLKLSQGEHLALIESFKIVSEHVKATMEPKKTEDKEGQKPDEN
jgi:glycine cleavage system H lipoate-binding protein